MPPSQPSKAPGETESGSASAPGPHDPAIGAPFINLEHVLDRISDAFIVCEKDWRIAYVNRSYLDLIAPIYSSADQILGGNLWEKFPDIVDSPTGRFYRDAMEHQVAGTHELYYSPVQAWLQVRAMPTPEALTLYIRNISAQKTAERALQKRSERMQLLSETLRQLLAAVDPNTIVRELFAKVAAHLEVDTYFNFMVSPDGNRLRLHSCAGIPPEAALNLSTLEFGQAVCGTVAEIRRPIIATDVQNSDWDKCQVIRGFGIQTYACNPLMVGDKLLGTLSFGSRLRPNFDEDELEFIRVVTQSAAVALESQSQGGSPPAGL
ncbi:MAG: GAF domain-containing protein, partial [Verrucomicrobium sp.]